MQKNVLMNEVKIQSIISNTQQYLARSQPSPRGAEGDHNSQSFLGKIQIRFHLSPTFVECTSFGKVRNNEFSRSKSIF